MSTTYFGSALRTGTSASDPGTTGDAGGVVLVQTISVARDATLVQSGTATLPAGSQIVAIYADVTTAYDSATSATLTVGSAAAGTQYASGLNAKTAGRSIPSLSAAQCSAIADISTNTTVYATVTSVGQPTTGAVRVIIEYVQKS